MPQPPWEYNGGLLNSLLSHTTCTSAHARHSAPKWVSCTSMVVFTLKYMCATIIIDGFQPPKIRCHMVQNVVKAVRDALAPAVWPSGNVPRNTDPSATPHAPVHHAQILQHSAPCASACLGLETIRNCGGAHELQYEHYDLGMRVRWRTQCDVRVHTRYKNGSCEIIRFFETFG